MSKGSGSSGVGGRSGANPSMSLENLSKKSKKTDKEKIRIIQEWAAYIYRKQGKDPSKLFKITNL
jgi:hypothetical protein